MRLRHVIRTSAAGAVFALAIGSASPVAAQLGGYSDLPPQPQWDEPHPSYGMDPVARDAWLADCRHRLSRRDTGIGGAVIGGLVGGVAGNRIAGRGDRTVGTIAGAAVGAAAGMAIDKTEDNGRVRDECEAYLEDYYTRYRSGYTGSGGYNYGQNYGHGPAYGSGCCGAPMMMVPVTMVPRGEPECTETVEYEYVDVPVRAAPPKRVRTAPEKRVKVVPIK